MFNSHGTGYTLVTRPSLPVSRGATIDTFLQPEDVEPLYKLWNKAWGEPFEYSGGETAITCEMVAVAPLKEMQKVYGNKLALRLKAVANREAAL
jgi:hypothetical protein